MKNLIDIDRTFDTFNGRNTPRYFFIVNFFIIFQNTVHDEVLRYLKGILRYFGKTKFLEFKYTRNNEQLLVCFVDTNWGNDENDNQLQGFY